VDAALAQEVTAAAIIPAIMATIGVVREKETGSIANFRSTPISKFEFLFGKAAPCPCSKIYPWGNGSPLKNVAEDFAMEHLALSGPERLARVLGAIASSGFVADRNELSGRNGRACVVTMGA
jgi:hypothetical protein